MADHNSPTKPSLSDLHCRFASMSANERKALDPVLGFLANGLLNDREAGLDLDGTTNSHGGTRRLGELERDLRVEAARLASSTSEPDRGLANTILDHCDHLVPSLPDDSGEHDQDEGGPRP